MRIPELFDELNEHELDELLDLPVRGTAAVSVRRVRRRVNRALDADPAERRVHMKQAYKKGICAALIAACLLTGAFAAATKLNLLRRWLDEDSIGELVVNTCLLYTSRHTETGARCCAAPHPTGWTGTPDNCLPRTPPWQCLQYAR